MSRTCASTLSVAVRGQLRNHGRKCQCAAHVRRVPGEDALASGFRHREGHQGVSHGLRHAAAGCGARLGARAGACTHTLAACAPGAVAHGADALLRQEFLRTTEAAFRTHSLWRNATEEELEASGEGLEKYLMTKIYGRTFAVVPDDVERDRVRSRRRSAAAQRA